MEALAHSFFDELRTEDFKLPNSEDPPDLFNFSEEEINSTKPEIMKKLVPSWYKNGSK